VAFAREAGRVGIGLRVCCLKRIDGNPLEGDLVATGVPLDVLDAKHLRDRRAFGRLRRTIRDGRFDLVHAHLTYATIWGVAAARLERTPSIATLHVPPSAARPWDRGRVRERLMCGLLKRSETTVIAVSSALRDRYLRHGLLDPRHVIVVRNGIEVERATTVNERAAGAVRQEFSIPVDAPVLITTALLRDPRKGVQVLLEAVSRLRETNPSAHLLVIGDGPLRPGLEARARELGIERSVRWAGLRRDVGALLAGGDLYVHPALDDPLPTAVLEAMAAALPVVASRVDGIPEMVGEEAGRLVPPSNPARLASALTDLLSDSDLRRRLGASARQIARERFSAGVWAQGLRDAYLRTIGAGPRQREATRAAP
jgi:glycosyltransferase involved in cell wall biosynthesis